MRKLVLVLFIFLIIPSLRAQEAAKGTSIQYLAHRGASYLAPENTLASIQLAWELGADAAECDIMLSADKRVILFHDKNTQKLTGQNFVVKETPWQQLKSLVVIPRESNRPEYQDETIPLLKDVLATIPDDRMLVIEIKTGPEILPHLQKVIDSHWKQGSISFIAFDFETIKRAKALYPGIPCYYLSSVEADLNKHISSIVKSGLDGVDLSHQMIDGKLMDRCRAAGLDVWCWTVNDPQIALKMKELGVSAITTDRPAWLKKCLVNWI
jgi:glycerophosphoryl diester phosphodiesterase